jgi:hypothetical protein
MSIEKSSDLSGKRTCLLSGLCSTFRKKHTDRDYIKKAVCLSSFIFLSSPSSSYSHSSSSTPSYFLLILCLISLSSCPPFILLLPLFPSSLFLPLSLFPHFHLTFSSFLPLLCLLRRTFLLQCPDTRNFAFRIWRACKGIDTYFPQKVLLQQIWDCHAQRLSVPVNLM